LISYYNNKRICFKSKEFNDRETDLHHSKNKYFFKKIGLITLALGCVIFPQGQKEFFSLEKMIETGVYYYPEAWKPEQWDRDFLKMEDMGLESTHMAEFAWTQMKPTEGNFDFKWLVKAVELPILVLLPMMISL